MYVGFKSIVIFALIITEKPTLNILIVGKCLTAHSFYHPCSTINFGHFHAVKCLVNR